MTSGVMMSAPVAPPGGAVCTNEYSTDLWGQLAVQAAAEHNTAAASLYIHLCFEAVHTPYDAAPGDPTGDVYTGMVWRADVYIGELVALLKSKKDPNGAAMYENTLFVYAGDNGGVGSGNNFPLRECAIVSLFSAFRCVSPCRLPLFVRADEASLRSQGARNTATGRAGCGWRLSSRAG